MELDLRKRIIRKKGKKKKVNTGTDDNPKHKINAKQEQFEGRPSPWRKSMHTKSVEGWAETFLRVMNGKVCATAGRTEHSPLFPACSNQQMALISAPRRTQQVASRKQQCFRKLLTSTEPLFQKTTISLSHIGANHFFSFITEAGYDKES